MFDINTKSIYNHLDTTPISSYPRTVQQQQEKTDRDTERLPNNWDGVVFCSTNNRRQCTMSIVEIIRSQYTDTTYRRRIILIDSMKHREKEMKTKKKKKLLKVIGYGR